MLETVALDHIRTDGGTQPREYLNELVLGEYTEAMAHEADFPPLTLFFDGSHYWLADGFHRFFAAKQLGASVIAAEVHQGTRRDALLYAAGANATHGLRRTNADKRRAVLTLLQDEEWQRWSNREISRLCSVTHTFVGKLRQELVAKLSPDGEPPLTVSTETSTPARHASEALAERRSGTPLSRLYDDPPSTASDTAGTSHFSPVMYALPPSGGSAESAEDVAVPPLAVPQPEAVASRQDGTVKLSLDEMAAVSHQTPADWLAEMIAHWLLDVAHQYDGMTPILVQQVAERLVSQYNRARQDIACVEVEDTEMQRSDRDEYTF
jgi:hypothetical protein